MTRISLTIPSFNGEDAIPVFLARVVPIMKTTGHDYEMVFVDDGSRCASAQLGQTYFLGLLNTWSGSA